MHTLATIVEKHPELKDAIEYWALAWFANAARFQEDDILRAIEETRSIYESHLCTIFESVKKIPAILVEGMRAKSDGDLQKVLDGTLEKLQRIADKDLPNLGGKELEAITVLPIQIYAQTSVTIINASTLPLLEKVILARGLHVAYEKLASEVVTAVKLGLMLSSSG